MTHVVWQGGDEGVRDQGLKKSIKVVGPGWVEASYNNGKWVAEKDFLLKKQSQLSSGLRYLSDRLTVFGTKRKRSRSMEPKSIDRFSKTSTPALAKRLRRAVGSDRTEIYTDSSRSSVGVATLATTAKQNKTTVICDRSETSLKQRQQHEVIVIDDDSPPPQAAPPGRASLVASGNDDVPKSAAETRRQRSPNGLLSARDRYWDDGEEDDFVRRRRRASTRRKDSTALDLEAKLAEVVSPDGDDDEKLFSTDSSEAEEEAAPPKKRMRFSPPDDDARKKDFEDLLDQRASTPRGGGVGRHENAENKEGHAVTKIPGSPSLLDLVDRHRQHRPTLLVSGSGLDGAVRQALKSLCVRITSPKAKFVDNEVWMRMTGAAPPKATHLVVGTQRLDGGPRTLKVLFALARGGTAIVTPDWVFASQNQSAWLETSNFLAGFGEPRPTGQKILESTKVHVLSSALGSSDPARVALEALVKAAGGITTNKQREANVILVGAEFVISAANATLRALAKRTPVVKTRWLFDVIEKNDARLPKRPYLLTSA